MKVIKLGIIGGGLMGRELASAVARWCHLLDVDFRPEIVAVCSIPENTLEWFTANFSSVKQATTDYRELVQNPDVDAVYCAVPHDLHEEIYLDILESGKHLLGEKPFGIDRKANAAILEAIGNHPELVVRCSSQFPYFPAVVRIQEALGRGEFGRILEAKCGFLHGSDLNREKPINWKRIAARNGEYGCMGDLGMHVFHVPLRAGWKFKNVRAILSNIVPERSDSEGTKVPCDTWDNATMLCEVEKDDYRFPLIAETQRIAPGETNTWYLTIKGERLSARFTTKRPRTLETMRYEAGGSQRWETEDLGYESVYKSVTGKIFEFGFSDAFLQMTAAFCDQVAQGNNGQVDFGCVTPEETGLCHDILTAALQSHKNREVTSLDD